MWRNSLLDQKVMGNKRVRYAELWLATMTTHISALTLNSVVDNICSAYVFRTLWLARVNRWKEGAILFFLTAHISSGMEQMWLEYGEISWDVHTSLLDVCFFESTDNSITLCFQALPLISRSKIWSLHCFTMLDAEIFRLLHWRIASNWFVETWSSEYIRQKEDQRRSPSINPAKWPFFP